MDARHTAVACFGHGSHQPSRANTWRYLLDHAHLLDARGSSIYRKRPRFAVFGVGAYTFAPWKVAVSGLYKRLAFAVVGPHQGRPVVFDDTVYFLSCHSQDEADTVASLLRSSVAQDFYSAYIFWDAKRPITAEVLNQLNVLALARELGVQERLEGLLQAAAPSKTRTLFPL